MFRFIFAAVLGLSVLGVGGIASADTTVVVPDGTEVIVVAPTAPPAEIVETVTVRSGYVWSRGYWYWGVNRWAWRSGSWVTYRPGYFWVHPHHYYRSVSGHRRLFFVRGHWRR